MAGVIADAPSQYLLPLEGVNPRLGDEGPAEMGQNECVRRRTPPAFGVVSFRRAGAVQDRRRWARIGRVNAWTDDREQASPHSDVSYYNCLDRRHPDSS